MLKFLQVNSRNFKSGENNLGILFLISTVKFVAVILCVFLNMYLICNSNSMSDIVKDFVAIGIIADIDDIITVLIMSNNISQEIDEAELKFDQTKGIYFQNDLKLLKEEFEEHRHKVKGLDLFLLYLKLFVQFCCLGLIRVYKFLYDTIYYYFTPYMILGLIFKYG